MDADLYRLWKAIDALKDRVETLEAKLEIVEEEADDQSN